MNAQIGHLRRAGFAMLVISLIAVIIACGGVLYLAFQSAAAAADKADKPLRNDLTKIATMATGMLILTTVILFGVIIHHVAQRITGSADRAPATTYENAWAEAGRRLKPEDAPPVQGFEDDAENT